MAGQFMVHCILQLKSTFKSEMYIRPGLVPLFSVWFCLFFLFLLHSLCLTFFSIRNKEKQNSQKVSVPPDRHGFNESILGNCIIPWSIYQKIMRS